MDVHPHWTAYLTALLTPVVAALGLYIAFRQWRLSQNKLKLDLFDRRFSVYSSARSLLASIMTTGQAKEAEIYKFLSGTQEAKWLLNDEIVEYLDKQLWKQACDLQTLQDTLESMQRGVERTQKVNQKYEALKWFGAQYSELDRLFSPFLQLHH
jgi:hypothetical protein